MNKLYITLLLTVITSVTVNAQFGKLLDIAVEKIQKKNNSKQNNNSPTEVIEINESENNTDNATEANDTPEKKEIVFPLTGKLTKTVVLIYGMDYDKDLQKIINAPGGKATIKIARTKGLKGTDLEVMKALMQNPKLFDDIQKQTDNQFNGNDNEEESFSCPSFVFNMFVGAPKYTISSNYIRSDIQASENGQTSLAGMFGGNPVGLVDLKNNIQYAIMNSMGMQVAVTSPIKDYSLAGMTSQFQSLFKIQGVTGKISSGTLNQYPCTVTALEIPVKPTIGKDGKQDDGLLFVHSMLSGNMDDVSNKKYKSSYKIFLQTYYTTTLNSSLPNEITNATAKLQNQQGILAGFKIKDEKGNEAIYMLKEVQLNKETDQGLFQIPQGYEIMTSDEFGKKLKAKFKLF
jgi:hypothetical protein